MTVVLHGAEHTLTSQHIVLWGDKYVLYNKTTHIYVKLKIINEQGKRMGGGN